MARHDAARRGNAQLKSDRLDQLARHECYSGDGSPKGAPPRQGHADDPGGEDQTRHHRSPDDRRLPPRDPHEENQAEHADNGPAPRREAGEERDDPPQAEEEGHIRAGHGHEVTQA